MYSFARMGYVVASIDYRVGWNLAATQSDRTNQLINAAYREFGCKNSC